MELLAIVILPAALTHTFGRMVGRPRDGWVIFWTMTALFIAGLIACNWAESTSHPSFACDIAGGNMEGKEQRFGIAGSTLGSGSNFEHVHRFLQFDGRQFSAARCRRAISQHASWRNYFWRTWWRALWNDLRRVDRAFHWRIDDRSHAGTSRQTNWPAGDEDHRHLHTGCAGHNPRVSRACSCNQSRSRRINNEYRPSWLHRNSFRLRELLCQQRSNDGKSQR